MSLALLQEQTDRSLLATALARIESLCAVGPGRRMGRRAYGSAVRRVMLELTPQTSPGQLASLYQTLQTHCICRRRGRYVAEPDPSRAVRRGKGTYYTPTPLIECLLDAALEPLLGEARRAPDPQAALLDLRICDPACGAGHFLAAAATRIAAALADARGDASGALRDVLRCCIRGVDVDPVAVELTRQTLGSDLPAAHVSVGDALLDEWPFDDEAIDLVLGNPPFVNAIENRTSARMKDRLRARFPRLGGTADLAHCFLQRSVELVRDGGRVALVLPRAVLNAPACETLRAALPRHLRPNLIYAPERCDQFPGANVFVCLLVLGPDVACRVSIDPDPDGATWTTGGIGEPNWWRGTCRVLGLVPADVPRQGTVGDVFDVAASMTAGDAYDLKPFLTDADHAGLRFVTTGLIEPGHCTWGQTRCRYLGEDFANPRIIEAPGLTPSLRGRLAKSRRPKVLVAGLTRRVECFLDEQGQFAGGVSTFSIYHPADDRKALADLCRHLLSEPVGQRFVAELGGSGLRGRHITMSKAFLRSLPMPIV